jgi:hypothetical protein
MKKIILGVGAVALLSTACLKTGGDCDSGDSVCDTGDTTTDTNTGCETYAGAVSLGVDMAACDVPTTATAATPAISSNCDSADWWFDIYVIGLASSSEIWITQSTASAWSEAHPFLASNANNENVFSDSGHWDNYYFQFGQVTEVGAVSEGTTTLFKCTDDRKSTLGQFVRITDSGGAALDCDSMGAQASMFDAYLSDCSDPWS